MNRKHRMHESHSRPQYMYWRRELPRQGILGRKFGRCHVQMVGQGVVSFSSPSSFIAASCSPLDKSRLFYAMASLIMHCESAVDFKSFTKRCCADPAGGHHRPWAWDWKFFVPLFWQNSFTATLCSCFCRNMAVGNTVPKGWRRRPKSYSVVHFASGHYGSFPLHPNMKYLDDCYNELAGELFTTCHASPSRRVDQRRGKSDSLDNQDGLLHWRLDLTISQEHVPFGSSSNKSRLKCPRRYAQTIDRLRCGGDAEGHLNIIVVQECKLKTPLGQPPVSDYNTLEEHSLNTERYRGTSTLASLRFAHARELLLPLACAYH